MDMSLFDKDCAPEDSTEPTNYAAIELSAECKPDPEADDPFDDSEPNYQATSEKRRGNFGQITSYAALVFAKQQRTHLFSVVFLGNMARIVRWDRGGAIVTKKFNYVEEPEKLAKFFWHFVRLSDAQRGHDTSVTRVLTTSADYRLMQDRAENPRLEGKHAMGEHARLLFQESLRGTSRGTGFGLAESRTAITFSSGLLTSSHQDLSVAGRAGMSLSTVQIPRGRSYTSRTRGELPTILSSRRARS